MDTVGYPTAVLFFLADRTSVLFQGPVLPHATQRKFPNPGLNHDAPNQTFRTIHLANDWIRYEHVMKSGIKTRGEVSWGGGPGRQGRVLSSYIDQHAEKHTLICGWVLLHVRMTPGAVAALLAP